MIRADFIVQVEKDELRHLSEEAEKLIADVTDALHVTSSCVGDVSAREKLLFRIHDIETHIKRRVFDIVTQWNER